MAFALHGLAFALHGLAFALHGLAFALFAHHRFAGHRFALRGLVQLFERLLLLLNRLREVALLERLRGFLSVGGRGRLLHLLGLLGDLLLLLGEVLRLVLLKFLGLLRLFGGLVRLFDRLGQLLGGVLRVHLVRLKRGLIGDLFRLQFVGLLLERLLGLLQLLGGFVRLVGGGHRFVLVEVLLGRLHLFGAFVDLLGGVRGGVLHVLRHVLGLRRQLLLLLGQFLVLALVGVGRLLRVLGEFLLLLGQLLELLLGLVDLGHVLAALFDLRSLLVERLLGGLERLERLFLLRLGLVLVLVRELLGGLVGLVRGLLQGLGGFLLVGQGKVLEFVGLLGNLLLRLGDLVEVFRLLGVLRLGLDLLLLLDQLLHLLGGLLGGGEGVGLLLLGGGDLLVEFVPRLLEALGGVLLGGHGLFGAFVDAQFVLRPLHLGLGRRQLRGGLLRHVLERLADLARLEFELGLFVREPVRLDLLRILGVAFEAVGFALALLGRLGLFGFGLEGVLGLERLFDAVAQFLHGGDLVARRAEGRGERLQFLRDAQLPVGGALELAAVQVAGGDLHVGADLAALAVRVRLIEPDLLVGVERRPHGAELRGDREDLAAQVALGVGLFLAVVAHDAPGARGDRLEVVRRHRLQVQAELVLRELVDPRRGLVERFQNVQLVHEALERRDDLPVLQVRLALFLRGRLLVGRLQRAVEVLEHGLDLFVAEAFEGDGHFVEHLLLGAGVELLVAHRAEGGADAPDGLFDLRLHLLLLDLLRGRIQVRVGGRSRESEAREQGGEGEATNRHGRSPIDVRGARGGPAVR